MKANKGKRRDDDKMPKKDEANINSDDLDTSQENTTAEVTEDDCGEAAAAESVEAGDKTPDTNANDKELAAERERYMRLYAEYENFRKRSVRERELIYSDVRGDTVLKFLPIYDNLLRAAEHETADDAYKKGIELIVTQFKDVLDKLGVTEISSVGETFDPEMHNAVMHVDDDEKGENEIVEEFQKGFKLGDRVLRFSMVKVAN